MESKMQVRTFHCPNCGMPLDIPKGTGGKIVCPSCLTESIIENLVRNAEILQKENINSGIPMTAGVQSLYNSVVEALTSSPCVPLDVLDQVDVTTENHLGVPAYLFSCSATGTYNYEAGNTRQHKNVYRKGNYIVTEKENYTEWTQMAGSASVMSTVTASGRREFAEVVTPLYSDHSFDSLVDVEELEFPDDVVMYSYNQPHATALNNYCRPIIEKQLLNQVANGLNGKVYRNLSMTGVNIHTDEMLRVLLGIYHITCTYKDKKCNVFVTGDGRSFYCDDYFIDDERQKYLNEREDKLANVRNPKAWMIAFSLVLLVFSLFASSVLQVLELIGGVALLVIFIKKSMEARKLRKSLQQEIDAFKTQAQYAKNSFIKSGRTLKGIYSSDR